MMYGFSKLIIHYSDIIRKKKIITRLDFETYSNFITISCYDTITNLTII